MAAMSKSKSAAVRARLDHPVIDSDGHLIEFMPAFFDYLKEVGGSAVIEGFRPAMERSREDYNWGRLTPAERREARACRPVFWGVPTKNTIDLAAAFLPELLHRRLDDLGLDFTVLYPGLGLTAVHLDDDEVRRASCRALNRMYADLFGEFADRMTPAAVIPMHTPGEAIEELEYAVNTLGLKAAVMASYVKRPIAGVVRAHPAAAPYAFYIDTFGIDSEYDYDPLWAKCLELGVVPSFHSRSIGWTSRASISNYVYNHIGHFAASAEALCKSLFLGGVTRRFPSLKFSFLEGGVGWARSLLADLIGHWEKRNLKALASYDPRNLDRELFAEMFRRHGQKVLRGKDFDGRVALPIDPDRPTDLGSLDDFARCRIERREDIGALFVPNFYFGCESDDPVTASAFDAKRNPLGARLNAIYGSDIGHWDVPDMTEILQEAYEAVEHGAITGQDFRDFVFANPARLWAGSNPNFFKGTVVENAVAAVLSN